MTTQYYTGPNYGARFLSFLLALLLGAAAFAFFVRHETTGKMGRILTRITGRAASIDTSVPAVVEKIQRLNRLETVVYSMDTVVPDGLSLTTPSGAPGDRVPLVVHGKSIAGIDLAQLKPEDVRIDADGHGIQVTLPPAQLFSTKLDDQRTRVLVRSTGTLVPMNQALGPETRARAQDQLQQAALGDGILDAARRNAHATVTALLYSLGFEQVDVK
ncbi:MAG: DUF4230 domain-containing protein [Acidobacteriaceae bacterium]|jgi:hypothetical protein